MATSKQANKHTHARAQCSHANVGLAHARPNNIYQPIMPFHIINEPEEVGHDHMIACPPFSVNQHFTGFCMEVWMPTADHVCSSYKGHHANLHMYPQL